MLVAFEENIFPLPKPYVFVKMNGKKNTFLLLKEFIPKNFKLNFLEKK